MIVSAAQLVPQPLDTDERAALKRTTRHAVAINVLGTSAHAHFDDPAAARRFAARYRALLGTLTPAVRTYAARDEAGTRFWSDDGEAYLFPVAGLDPYGIAFLADAVTTDALFAAIPDTVAFHAAALRYQNCAFALTGLSAAGKSTTALACAAVGCGLFSDERCVVTPRGVVPYPRGINVRAGGRDLLVRELADSSTLGRRLRAWGDGDWDNASFADLLGEVPLPDAAPLRAMFAIVGCAAQPSVRRITPYAMLSLAQPGAKAAARGLDRVAALLRVLGDVHCYELVLGTPLQTARALMACIDRELP